ncbi:MAG TPA: hypothetical protein VNI20_11865 [Fimbriimonadaceae bacterium]|nr:hypothetical protein [Fimbriimonadaceae bacterium]
MRSYEFKQHQIEKKKKWARGIVASWSVDPDSPRGRRQVGRVARSHTYCGCSICKWVRRIGTPTRRMLRSDSADLDSLND